MAVRRLWARSFSIRDSSILDQQQGIISIKLVVIRELMCAEESALMG